MPLSLSPVIAGTPFDIGVRLGELARPVFDTYMQQSSAWQAVRRWRGHPFVDALRQAALAAYPDLVAELDGIAAGVDWHADDIFLWNCRGELIHDAPDGCTTLAAREANGTRWIAHNEDGDPYLRERCLLVDVQPAGKPGFISFYYPGSLPGHTFAANRAGIAQAINNLRIHTPAPGVPRMILARAVLDATSLDAAANVLRSHARASGFHHTIGATGDARLLSIEASVARCSIVDVTRLTGHANHLVHPGCDADAQIVTQSSVDRQRRVDALTPGIDTIDEAALLRVLGDRAPEGLPIYRDDPADPDDENTLATAVFAIHDTAIDFTVHQHGAQRFTTRIVPSGHASSAS
ncbi:C45 family peptidase [Burkholderia sp. AU42008]|uniref:C45 family autoproteolytic acyltransferase/hydolase n=1 Tax=unclassified Burkholderia TaxID=2613784 RepID=UPI000B79DCEC|nr:MULTISPECIES: C45 family peptidase [unclassified Burkholderia]MBR8233388.1 peptidase C45 [Burkholderia sp. AU32357]MBY4875482.1 C45 family peptidase [Burkholderia sp. AU42008]OXI40502.1 peptidase C45 [Burkholderia sp. AU17457]